MGRIVIIYQLAEDLFNSMKSAYINNPESVKKFTQDQKKLILAYINIGKNHVHDKAVSVRLMNDRDKKLTKAFRLGGRSNFKVV